MKRLFLFVSAGALLLGWASACTTASKHSPAPSPEKSAQAAVPRDLPPREQLPVYAREMLSARMVRHADQMTILMAGVVLLNDDAAEALAEEIAQEPKLDRPSPGEHDTLNALLPRKFFDLQDELKVRARDVADAARAHDNTRLGKAFGTLAETCVACHAAFLYEEVGPSPE